MTTNEDPTPTQEQRNLTSEQLAALYAEFAEEDRLLAEEGMEDYYQGLLAEDVLQEEQIKM